MDSPSIRLKSRTQATLCNLDFLSSKRSVKIGLECVKTRLFPSSFPVEGLGPPSPVVVLEYKFYELGEKRDFQLLAERDFNLCLWMETLLV